MVSPNELGVVLRRKKNEIYGLYTGGDFCENFPLKKKTSVKILNRKSTF
jgi:hypothetical protein